MHLITCLCTYLWQSKKNNRLLRLLLVTLQMRVLLDHSCVEVYLSSGEVLSTRVYRGHPPHGSDAGIDFVAYGGTARVEVSLAITLNCNLLHFVLSDASCMRCLLV